MEYKLPPFVRSAPGSGIIKSEIRKISCYLLTSSKMFWWYFLWFLSSSTDFSQYDYSILPTFPVYPLSNASDQQQLHVNAKGSRIYHKLHTSLTLEKVLSNEQDRAHVSWCLHFGSEKNSSKFKDYLKPHHWKKTRSSICYHNEDLYHVLLKNDQLFPGCFTKANAVSYSIEHIFLFVLKRKWEVKYRR